jgi:hypothetical protein
MRISLATIGFVVWLTLRASAQGACTPGPGPDGNPLSYEQWYSICGAQITQMCNTMRNISPYADCNAIANSQYQTYVISVRANGGQPPCSQYNNGAQACINGWVATCDGTMWRRSSNQCGM